MRPASRPGPAGAGAGEVCSGLAAAAATEPAGAGGGCNGLAAAAALVRDLGGPAAATFRQETAPVSFAAAEQFTVREWAETLRATGYMARR